MRYYTATGVSMGVSMGVSRGVSTGARTDPSSVDVPRCACTAEFVPLRRPRRTGRCSSRRSSRGRDLQRRPRDVGGSRTRTGGGSRRRRRWGGRNGWFVGCGTSFCAEVGYVRGWGGMLGGVGVY